MTGLNVTRVVAGKKVIPKAIKPIETSKADVFRWLITQLHASLTRNSRIFKRIYYRNHIDKVFLGEIERFTSSVIQVIDSFPKSGQRVPAKFFKDVLLLKPKLGHYQIYCSQNIPLNNQSSRRLAITTQWLADDIKHFISQVEQNYTSIAALVDHLTGKILPPSNKEIPNRHRDPKKEAVFLEALKQYQVQGGKKKFMPYKFAEAHGLSIPERTYRTYKTDYLAGNFGKLAK